MMLFSKTFLFTIGLPCLVIATQNLPKVTLPWGTWQARSLDADNDFYTFRNIRFGDPPNGTARFQISTRPKSISHPEDSLMDNTCGPICIQVNTNPSNTPQNPTDVESEDCLFLDIYVPKSVFEKAKNGIADTPVVVWIYGGGFINGAKDAYGPDSPFFKGDGLLQAAAKIHEDVIFVAGNYRLGAFGWLAGSEIEKSATANAGLHDQRLLFEWVQDYISLFGGNKKQVSALGESAGGGSIVHHLLQKNGTRDPLFRRALVQSPAFQWKWDRAPGGRLDQVYQNFSKLADCSTGGIDCLVKADVETLRNASQQLYEISYANGVLPVGPAIDNDWISYLPAVAFHKGLFWKKLDSLLVSHVAFESPIFVPPYIEETTHFDTFLDHFIHETSLDNKVRTAIKARYPPIDLLRYFDKQKLRAGVVIQDSTFTCKTRQLFDAYHKTTDTYMLQYYAGIPFHAADLIPTFWIPTIKMAQFLGDLGMGPGLAYITELMMTAIAPVYQRYIAGFATNGNPNSGFTFPFLPWKPATLSLDGNVLMNVLKVQSQGLVQFDVNSIDLLNTRAICDFWTTVEHDMSGIAQESEAEAISQPENDLQRPLEL